MSGFQDTVDLLAEQLVAELGPILLEGYLPDEISAAAPVTLEDGLTARITLRVEFKR